MAKLITISICFLILIIFELIIKNKTSKTLLILCNAIHLTIAYFMCKYFILSEILPKKILSYLCVILFVLVTLIISLKILKSKIKFGNYCLINFHFLINRLKSKNKNVNSITIGTVIPFARYDINKNGIDIELNNKQLEGGTICTGSTGSGKTYGMKQLIKQDFKNGSPIVFFDYKGDPKIRKELIEDATKFNYSCYCFNEYGYEYFMDPLAGLTTTGRIETILNSRKWDISGADSHYKTNLKLLIQTYVSNFDKFLNKKLEENMMSMNEFPYTEQFTKFVEQNKPDLSKRSVADAYDSLLTLLKLLLTSEAKNTFDTNNTRKFSFEDKIKYNENNYLLIISIPSESKELADCLTSFYLNNLMSVGVKYGFNPDIKVYIDEFGTLQNPFVVKDMLEKGRSMGVCSMLAMQDIFQIVINTNEAYLDSLLSTVNNFIIYAGSTKKSAEKISGTQIKDIDKILLSLRRPANGTPTALWISKNATLNKKKTSEVYKIFPYDENGTKLIDLFGEADDDDSPTNSHKLTNHLLDNKIVDIEEFKDLI